MPQNMLLQHPSMFYFHAMPLFLVTVERCLPAFSRCHFLLLDSHFFTFLSSVSIIGSQHIILEMPSRLFLFTRDRESDTSSIDSSLKPYFSPPSLIFLPSLSLFHFLLLFFLYHIQSQRDIIHFPAHVFFIFLSRLLRFLR